MTTAIRTSLPEAPAHVDADLWTKIRQRYLYYWEQQSGLWSQGRFLGTAIEKLPTDAWIYQELLASVRPHLLIETGTLAGGSAKFFATIMDAIGCGEVISVDITDWPVPGWVQLPQEPRPQHPRITYLLGSATDPAIVTQLREVIDGYRRTLGTDPTVMVVLDDDHSAAHVRKELDLYAPLVTVGSYLVVEDTGLTGATNPQRPNEFGAAEGLADWLPSHPEFQPDPNCERFLLTAHPGGWLRRVR